MAVYDKYLTEAKLDAIDRKVVATLEKKFGVKIKKMDVRKKVVIQLKDGIDENEFENFSLIDGINDFLEKAYGTGIVTHDFDKFMVEQ